jgi:Flp pilus assembly protein TadD
MFTEPSKRVPAGSAPPALLPSAGAWGRREWLVLAGLLAATFVTFLPVLYCGFVNYDDDVYVTDNPLVRGGLTAEGLWWGLTTLHFGNWHPLVWWSFQLDAQLSGKDAAGFHRTNLLWHLGSVALLFVALRRMTGQTWPSALVAALFAIHPLNVESVAWVSERKGVISTFFWMLALTAYAGYAARPGWVRYLMVALSLVLGLMAKPMLVTLPCALLLLDYWPLRRFGRAPAPGAEAPPFARASFGRLVVEKLPLLALSGAFSVLASAAQNRIGALPALSACPVETRLENVAFSYLWYLRQAVHPSNLAAYHPFESMAAPALQAAAAALALAAVTFLVLRRLRSAPYLAVGWLWYLGTLLPVSGLVQVGSHARADRYVYVPLVGVFLLVAWGLTSLARRWDSRRRIALLAGAALLFLAFSTWTQAHSWQDSFSLWRHALRVTEANPVANNNLGDALARRGEWEQAVLHFQEALRLRPDYAVAHVSMGTYLLQQGALAEAASEFREAIRLQPNRPKAHHHLATVLMCQGDPGEAIAHLREALRLGLEEAEVHNKMGVALLLQAEPEAAAACFVRATALQPEDPTYRRHHAFALLRAGRRQEA